MKIIIIALVLGVLMCSGCVITPDYTGTYVGPKETLTLLDDGSFIADCDRLDFSGTYTITDEKIYFKHPFFAITCDINETCIYDDKGKVWVKQ